MSKILNSIFVILCFGIIISGQVNADSKTGTVEGTTVIFIRGNINRLAVMPGVEVCFNLGEKEFKTITQSNGEFSVNLPDGIYSVNTYGIRKSYDFIKRARIKVEANKLTKILLFPTSNYFFPFLNYSSFVPDKNQPELDLVIQANKKKIGKKVYRFKRAYLTYNTATKYANELIFSLKDFSFEAKNGVLAQINGERSRSDKITGNFVNGKLILK